MELTTRLSTLTLPQQTKVIERAFQKMFLGLGNKLTMQWQGMNMQDIYSAWADSLGEFSIAAIAYSAEQSMLMDWAPNLGEFKKHCLNYKPDAENVLRIAKKITPEQQAKNRERLKRIAEMFAEKKSM
jgi:hypothetical protein